MKANAQGLFRAFDRDFIYIYLSQRIIDELATGNRIDQILILPYVPIEKK